MKLQQYDYTVRDWPDKQCQNTDTLSRIDTEGFIRQIFNESNTWKEVKLAQEEDKKLIEE